MKKSAAFIRFMWVFNTILAMALILSWVTYFIPASKFTGLSFFNLITPILLFFHSLFLMFWGLLRNRRFFLSSLCLLVSLVVFGSFYKLKGSKLKGTDSEVSVMSYNVRNLNKNEQMAMANVDSAIMKFILRESPDIVSIQESHYALKRKTLLDDTYAHKFVDFEYGVPRTDVINALYSKYPIINFETIEFPKSDNGAIYADLLVHGDTIRVYNVHLQSFNVIPDVEHLQNEKSTKLFKRVSRGLKRQEEQSLVIRDHISNCAYPIVITGDFNNTQFSKVYRTMKGDLTDTFLQGGSGWGRTFKFFGFPMRIDYIFTDAHFEVRSHHNFDVELSDHFPIMARLNLRSH